MRLNTFIIIITSLTFFQSCVSQKNYEENFNLEFFRESTVQYSIKNMLKNTTIKNVLIYDKNSLINKSKINLDIKTDSLNFTITNKNPDSDIYILVGDYIVNDDLALITLAPSSRENYKTFYLKKIRKHKKWFISGISEGNSR